MAFWFNYLSRVFTGPVRIMWHIANKTVEPDFSSKQKQIFQLRRTQMGSVSCRWRYGYGWSLIRQKCCHLRLSWHLIELIETVLVQLYVFWFFLPFQLDLSTTPASSVDLGSPRQDEVENLGNFRDMIQKRNEELEASNQVSFFSFCLNTLVTFLWVRWAVPIVACFSFADVTFQFMLPNNRV